MKLNPSKCAFGVSSGKFLGFIVSHRGIETNPKKVRAILEMCSPRTTKEVQSFTGRVAALNRIVSKATDKCLPFFKTLKKAFAWTEECETAFQELKHYLSNPPLLSPSKEGEDLFLYLAVSVTAVSAALIREEKQGATPGVLCQPGLPRCRSAISAHREDHLRPDSSFEETSSILPS